MTIFPILINLYGHYSPLIFLLKLYFCLLMRLPLLENLGLVRGDKYDVH